MLLLYARYVFIFSLMIDSNQGELLLTRKLYEEDKTLLQLAACSKHCLQWQPQKLFNECYEQCKGGNELQLQQPLIDLRKVQENFQLKLVCRTESKLTFRINWVQHSRSNVTIVPDVLFIIKINSNNGGSSIKTQLYLSDEHFLTLTNLEANATHNVTALAVHSDGAYSLISLDETFQTLRRGYQPSKMGQVKLRGFKAQPEDWQKITAEVEWLPSADRNCYFNVLHFSTNSQNMEIPEVVLYRDPRQLYSYEVANMSFGEQFKVGVRTVNDKNLLESEVEWLILSAPNCLDWFVNNYTLCPPLKPSNMSVVQHQFEPNVVSLNVSWDLPNQLPTYYELYVLDLHMNSSGRESYVLDPELSYYFIPNITIWGANFEVHLAAYTPGGKNSTMQFLSKVPLDSFLHDRALIKLMLFLLIPICCIVALCSFTLRRQPRQECSHLEIKDTKAAPSQSPDFHLSLEHNSSFLAATLAVEDNFDLEDELEVEPHAVQLQHVLGEGAFGLVRRGVYKQRLVAVKLLKDHPNEEDVQAFRCEIQMLKAVGKHPNIVGIVGYATRCSRRMMLLTEYCGLGSLQNFLRDEWKFRQEREAHQHLKPAAAVKHCLDYDQRIEDINRSILSTLEEETETEQSLSSYNSPETVSYRLGKAFLAADNKSYGLHHIENIEGNPAVLKDTFNPVKPNPVSFENQEYFQPQTAPGAGRKPLTYADLLDISQQVAVGMDFLAQNKIVHRDLAARNVLISFDRIIKIADFGLSRDVYHENVYRKSGGSGKLPIKWLALESLTHQVYTSQSDVWSFGVLLYEIITLGGMPYPSISPRDLLQLLRQGQRMKRPEGCTDELFALMESCWCSIPANRPTFAELVQRLDAMLLATKQVPQRLLKDCHSKVEHLPQDDGYYLQPLH